jgi:hypothetical protein
VSELTLQGIDLLKSGNKERARQVLAAAILEDREDAQAWLWLSGAVETDAERAACLQQVLRLDPLNQAAAHGLELLQIRHRDGTLAVLAAPADGPTVKAPLLSGNGSPDLARTQQTAAEHMVALGTLEATRPVRSSTVPAEHEPPEEAPNEVPVPVPEHGLFRLRPSLLPAILGGAVFILVVAMALVVVSGHPLVQYLVLLPAGFVGLKTVATQFAERMNEVYTLTTGRLRVESGGFKRQVHEMQLEQLSRVECRRGLLGTIFGTGTLLFYDAEGQVRIRLRDLQQCGRRVEQVAQAAGLVVGNAD